MTTAVIVILAGGFMTVTAMLLGTQLRVQSLELENAVLQEAVMWAEYGSAEVALDTDVHGQ